MEFSEKDLRAALVANPGDLEIERLLGVLCVKARQFPEGVERLDKIVRLRPDDFDAWVWLANGQKGLRDFEAAVASSRRAVALQPANAVAYHTLGQCLLAQRSGGQAIEAFRQAIQIDPNMAPAYHSLGHAYLLEDRAIEATDAFGKVTELAPGDLEGYLALSEQLLKRGDVEEGADCLERARKLFPKSPVVLTKLARAYAIAGNSEKAEKFFRLAVTFDPSASATYGVWLQEEARPDESAAAFRQSIAVQPMQGFAYYGLTQAKPDSIEPALRERMHRLSADPRLHLMEKMYLAYAEGRLAEREKRYEAAMSEYDRANEIAYRFHNAGRSFDRERQTAVRNQTMADFASRAHSVVPSDSEKPILIVGMIRSGTTLLDQMVSAHPDVASAGEMRFWIEEGARLPSRNQPAIDLSGAYLSALDVAGKGASRVTDKMPLNYTHLGLIHQSFPNARMVHIKRNPVDTCLSIYMTYLGASPYFAYRRDHIVFYYREYLRLMEFWRKSLPEDRLLEIEYESLVSDPEPVMREVLSFCGLPWDSACIHPEQNLSAIRTPSLWQARGPVVTTSVEKWRRYQPWLREFAELL